MSGFQNGQDKASSNIGFARVLAGAISFKDSGIANVSKTYRAQIYTADSKTRFAIIKDIPAKELANELMAAAIAAELGLPVPPAYIAFVPDGDIEIEYAPRVDGGNLVFASGDVDSPSIASIVSTTAFSSSSIRRIAEILLLGDLTGVYEFDTWSANVDRHPGNMLLSGSGTFWLIDQGYCFSGPDWAASDLVASAVFRNRLKEWLTPSLSNVEIDNLVSVIGTISSRVEEIDLREIGQRVLVPALIGEDDFEALLAFLTNRLPDVRRYTADALGRLM